MPTPDRNGTFLVTCRQPPEVTTYGETEEEALRQARDGIGVARGTDPRRDAGAFPALSDRQRGPLMVHPTRRPP